MRNTLSVGVLCRCSLCLQGCANFFTSQRERKREAEREREREREKERGRKRVRKRERIPHD